MEQLDTEALIAALTAEYVNDVECGAGKFFDSAAGQEMAEQVEPEMDDAEQKIREAKEEGGSEAAAAAIEELDRAWNPAKYAEGGSGGSGSVVSTSCPSQPGMAARGPEPLGLRERSWLTRASHGQNPGDRRADHRPCCLGQTPGDRRAGLS